MSNWGSFGSRGRPVRRPPERPVARAKPGDVQPATPGERLTWGEAPGEVRLAAESRVAGALARHRRRGMLVIVRARMDRGTGRE